MHELDDNRLNGVAGGNVNTNDLLSELGSGYCAICKQLLPIRRCNIMDNPEKLSKYESLPEDKRPPLSDNKLEVVEYGGRLVHLSCFARLWAAGYDALK